jgi:hypothetical protein
MRKVAAFALIALIVGGCGMGPDYTAPYAALPECPPGVVATAPAPVAVAPPPPTAYANPIFIPIADPECAWEQIEDVVDDYFRIESEDPARIVNNVPTEGTMRTVPEVSPTIFEPWRRDTGDPEQRTENTLQTMRRRAVIRVMPVQGGQNVEVAVFKDLEDNARPEHATAGAATFRYDSSLSRVTNPVGGDAITKGWINQGRDTSLEQQIICNLLTRTSTAAATQAPPYRP